jgi:hypothetical protein
MSDETALWLHNFKQLMFFVEVAKDNFHVAPNAKGLPRSQQGRACAVESSIICWKSARGKRSIARSSAGLSILFSPLSSHI